MRITNKVTDAINVSEVSVDAVPMSIDPDSNVFVMNMLGKLYNRPAQAVLREYLSNALDAHTAKGGELPPVQVTLPSSKTNSLLSVRDFGHGMSEEEFINVFSRYGASTKRHSNDFIGGFGLGAKSGFALGDEFFMTSYQNGKGLRVRVFKDSRNQGFVEVVERFETCERDGMLVEVNIPSAYLSELRASSSALNLFFMAYPVDAVEVSPKNDAFLSLHDSTSFTPLTLNGRVVGWVGSDSFFTQSLVIVVGNVVYKVKPSDLSTVSSEEEGTGEDLSLWLKFLSKMKRMKVLNIPVGTVEMPASREEITLSISSLNTIRATLHTFVSLLHAQFQNEINALSYMDAFAYVTEMEGEEYPRLSEFNWRGNPLGISLLQASSAYIKQQLYLPLEDRGRIVNDFQFNSFEKLSNVRKVLERCKYLYVITANDDEEVKVLNEKLDDEATFLNFLGTVTKNKDTIDYALRQLHVNVVVVSKTDAIFSLFSDCHHVEASSVHFAEMSAQEKAKKAQEEKHAKESQLLTSFDLNFSSPARFLRRWEPLQIYASKRGPMFYWSEEELENVSQSDSVLPAFPYGAGEAFNTYEVVPDDEEGHTWEHSYHYKLLSFLSLVLPKDSRIILLGKDTNLSSFRKSNPPVESGVEAVIQAVKEQLEDEQSVLNTARKLCAGTEKLNSNISRQLVMFYNKLTDEQKTKLPDKFANYAQLRASSAKWDKFRNYISASYLDAVLSVFCSDIETITNVEFEVFEAALNKQYPLLFAVVHHSYTEEILQDLVDYVIQKSTS